MKDWPEGGESVIDALVEEERKKRKINSQPKAHSFPLQASPTAGFLPLSWPPCPLTSLPDYPVTLPFIPFLLF